MPETSAAASAAVLANAAALPAVAPQAMEDRLAGLMAAPDWKRSREKSDERPATEEEMCAAPPVVRPVVSTHRETGAKALYLGKHAACIVGMSWPDSDALVAGLEAHATQPQYVNRHKWQVNGVLPWDSRCTMHWVEPYDAAHEKRAVHRAVVKGSQPH